MHADKTFASAVNNVGTVEYEKKHYGKAIGYYKKALDLHADMAAVYSNLGIRLCRGQAISPSDGRFQKALAIDPAVFDRKGGNGTVIQQTDRHRSGPLLFFRGEVVRDRGRCRARRALPEACARRRLQGVRQRQTDPAFAKVIKDPRVQEVLTGVPAYATEPQKPMTN